MRGLGRRMPGLARRGSDGASMTALVGGDSGHWIASNYVKEADPSVLVVSLADISGNARDLSQGTSSLRPSVDAGSILFPGVDELLAGATIGTFFTGDDMTVQIAMQPVAFTGSFADGVIYNARAAIGDVNGGVGISTRTNAGAEVAAWAFDGASKVISFAGAANEKMVISMRHTGGVLYASKNGGAESSVACGTITNTATALRLGRGFAAVYNNYRFYEAVVYPTALSASDMARNAVIIGDRWGF